MFKNNKQNTYQEKMQGKSDQRMNRHLTKQNLRHNAEITRLNEERKKKIEQLEAGIEHPGKKQEMGR